MPKGLKFKRGFTWRHHFDEWWDRRPQEWKVKVFILSALSLISLVGLLFWEMHHWLDRNEMLVEAKRIHQERIRNSDQIIADKRSSSPAPGLRDQGKIETRPAE